MVRSTKRPRIIQSLGKELYPEELQACTLPDGTIGEKGQLIIQTAANISHHCGYVESEETRA